MMKCMKSLSFALGLLLAAMPAAHGFFDGLTRDTAPPVRFDLAASRQAGEGLWQVVLHLDLAPGWKTYWRTPGPFGIPPRLTLVDGENVAGHELLLPEPRLIEDATGRYVGYKQDVRFVLSLVPEQPDAPVRASFLLDFAVCSDVCIPEQRQFSLSLQPGETSSPAEVAAALELMPVQARFVASISWNAQELQLKLSRPADNVLVESLSQGLGLSLPERLDERSYGFHVTSGELTPGSRLRLTLLNGLGGMEEVLELAAPAN